MQKVATQSSSFLKQLTKKHSREIYEQWLLIIIGTKIDISGVHNCQLEAKVVKISHKIEVTQS